MTAFYTDDAGVDHDIVKTIADLALAKRLLEVAECPDSDCDEGHSHRDGEWHMCEWCAERDELLAEPKLFRYSQMKKGQHPLRVLALQIPVGLDAPDAQMKYTTSCASRVNPTPYTGFCRLYVLVSLGRQ